MQYFAALRFPPSHILTDLAGWHVALIPTDNPVSPWAAGRRGHAGIFASREEAVAAITRTIPVPCRLAALLAPSGETLAHIITEPDSTEGETLGRRIA